MGRLLLAELLFDRRKKLVKFSRLDDRPWNNLYFSCVKAGDEVGVLLFLDDLLELKSEPICVE